MRRSAVACVVLAALASASCRSDREERAEPPADELTVGTVQAEIEVGMGAAEVAEVLGAPNIVTTDEERREVWIYDRISTERWTADRSSYGSLLLLGGVYERGARTTRQRTLTIIIKYDEQRRVRDFAYNYTQF